MSYEEARALYLEYVTLSQALNDAPYLDAFDSIDEEFDAYARGIEVLDAIGMALAHPMFNELNADPMFG